jgi:integrase
VLDSGQLLRMMAEGNAEPRRASGERKQPMFRRCYQNGNLTLRGKRKKVWVGRWREDVLGVDGNLERVRRSLVLGSLSEIPTRRQARRLLDAKLSDLNSGQRKPQSTMSFRQFIEDVWKPNVMPTFKFSTQKKYPHLINRHLLKVFGDTPLCEIRRMDVQRFVTDKMAREGFAWQTAAHLRNLMSGILQRAIEWGYLELNPARGVKLPPMQRRRKTVVLTSEQLAMLLRSLRDPVKTLAVTAAMTGLRIGEVLALRWSNVDLEKDVIRVREAVYDGHFSTPKTKSSIRDVPLGPALKRSLQDYRKDDSGDALVFASRKGTPLDAKNILRRDLRPTCARLGLPPITWHSFRHTHATLLSDLGESMKTAQAQLGHARLSTTAEIYTHAVPASQRAAVAKLENSIWTQVDPNSTARRRVVVQGATLIQ